MTPAISYTSPSLFRRNRLERSSTWSSGTTSTCAIQQNIARGMQPEEARREALRAFGAVQGIKDDVRDGWAVPLLESPSQDIRYGLRRPPPAIRVSPSS